MARPKEGRATGKLNVELSRVSAALSIIAQATDELPGGDTKSILVAALREATKGRDAAFELMKEISHFARMI